MPEADPAGRRSLSPGEFGTAFKAFLEQSTAQAPPAEPVLAGRLRRHLGGDPAGLPIVAEEYEPAEHPDLQVALDAWLQAPGRSSEAVGVAHDRRFGALPVSSLSRWRAWWSSQQAPPPPHRRQRRSPSTNSAFSP